MGITGNASPPEDNTPHLEYKCMGVMGFKADPQDEGVVTAIVAVTGKQDNVKDIIEPGAFEKSLATRTPKGVWHHNWHETISRTEAVKELKPGDDDLPKTLPNGDPWPTNAGGLQVKTRFNLETQRGREAHSDVLFFADQQEWSIGYNVPAGGATLDSKTGVRHIKYMDLYEYSPVLFGAMPAARTSSVKEAQLAYKSLFDTPTVVEEKEEEKPEEEKVEEEPKVEVEEKKFTPPTDKVRMTPGQASKLYKVMNQIMDLLRDAEVMVEEPDAAEVEKEALDAGGDVAGDEGGSNDTLSGMVADAFNNDEDLMIAADDFDAAYDAEDKEAMDAAADPIVSAVESAIDGGEDAGNYSDITDYIVSAFEDVQGSEEEAPPKEEPVKPEVPEDSPVTEVKPTTAVVGKKTLNMADFAGLLD